MSTQEINIIKELFEEKVKGLTALTNAQTTLMNAQFINVQGKLEDIEKQTIKTNGRVSKLEDMSNIHTNMINQYDLKCPQETRLRLLEDNTLTAKVVKKWITNSVAVTSAIMGIIWIIFKLINNVA